MPFRTDQHLWYNVGVWGELGYAVPNFGDDRATLNTTIHYLTGVIGRNLSAVMHHQDTLMRVPPSINTLTRVHKLITRARSILSGRQVPPGMANFESTHVSPAEQEFVIYPVPYFRVRNPWMKEYCGLVLAALSEAFQNTENTKAYEISTAFSGLIGQYLHRVYRLMATELFQVSADAASQPDFTLSEEQLRAYDPGLWFTQTELVDTVPHLGLIPTEDDLRVLTDGIPATKLVGLQKWPSANLYDPSSGLTGGATASGGGQTATSSGSFAPPPSV